MVRNNRGNVSRREFVPGAGMALAGLTILPRHVLGGAGYRAPSEKLNIAGVGVGGMGATYLFGRPEFGTVTGADPARIMQFGLKLYY